MRDETVKKYVQIILKIREHEADIDDLKEQAKVYEETLKKSFIERGIDKVTWQGNTVYLQREIWASLVGEPNSPERENAMEALRENGLGDYIRPSVNAQQLSAWARELERSSEGRSLEEVIPFGLRNVVKLSETFKLRVRKG